MTSTPTRPKPARPPRPEPLPAVMRIGRPILTSIAVILLLGGLVMLPVNFGRGVSTLPALAMLCVGFVLAVAAQQRAVYRVFERKTATVVTVAPASKTNRRPGRKAKKPTIPDVRPAESLGVEFGFVVLHGRYLAAAGRTDVLAEMQAFWNEIDWSEDVEADDLDDFRMVAELVYELVAERGDYDPDIDPATVKSGTFDPGNPFAFMAELESYHPMLGVVAGLMLVRQEPDMHPDMVDVVIDAWRELGQPYRFVNTVYELGPSGQYVLRQVNGTRKARPPAAPAASGETVPRGTLDEAIAEIAASRLPQAPEPPVQAPPKQAVPVPVPPPAPVPVPQVVVVQPEQAATTAPVQRADRDDVPNPTIEQILLAAELIIRSQLGSPPMIQRKLRIDRALTTKIMFRLRRHGIMRPPGDDGSCEVVVPLEELDETLDFITDQERRFAQGR